jgi:hypothetical protein
LSLPVTVTVSREAFPSTNLTLDNDRVNQAAVYSLPFSKPAATAALVQRFVIRNMSPSRLEPANACATSNHSKMEAINIQPKPC